MSNKLLISQGLDRPAYTEQLKQLTEAALIEETSSKIFLSAHAHNNAASDCHWRRDACWDECKRRGQDDIYDKAYNRATNRGDGHSWDPPKAVKDVASGEIMRIEVLKSAKGYYLGTKTKCGEPYSRESEEYWRMEEEAKEALLTQDWSARRHDMPRPADLDDENVSFALYQTSRGRRR